MERDRRPPGRPTTKAIEGQKHTLSIRASADLKTHLDDASKINGRSLSQEAEMRLENSFRDQGIIQTALGLEFGPELTAMLLIIGRGARNLSPVGNFITGLEYSDETAWLYSPFVFAQFEEFCRVIMSALRPAGSPAFERQPGVIANPDYLELPVRRREMGARYAEDLLAAVQGSLPDRPDRHSLIRFGADMRAKLGAAADRIVQPSRGGDQE